MKVLSFFGKKRIILRGPKIAEKNRTLGETKQEILYARLLAQNKKQKWAPHF
jgi:hypothetical protein